MIYLHFDRLRIEGLMTLKLTFLLLFFEQGYLSLYQLMVLTFSVWALKTLPEEGMSQLNH